MDVSNRRAFLSSVVAAPVAAVAAANPPTVEAAGGSPQVAASLGRPNVPTHFYVLYEQNVETGSMRPRDLGGNRAKLTDGHFHFNDDKLVTKRKTFVPLNQPNRFRMGGCDWKPHHPEGFVYPKWDLSKCEGWSEQQKADATAAHDAAWSEYHHARDGYLPPMHTLMLPPAAGKFSSPGGYCEGQEPELFTLDEGWAAVSQENERLIDMGYPDSDASKYHIWGVLIELGELVYTPLWNAEFEPNGMGSEEVFGKRPIRLVRPTMEEIKRFAVQYEYTAGSEGGAE